MMRLKHIGHLLLLISLTAFSNGGQVVNPKQFDHQALQKEVLNKVNQYRKANGASVLTIDSKLVLAAQDQADYVTKSGKLTHEQPVANKKGVRERIVYHGGKVSAYAENIAHIYVQKRCSVYNSKGDVEIKVLQTYSEVADALVNSWIKSSGHKRNMLTKVYTRTGIGLGYDPKTQNVVAVQVFGG